MKIIKSVIGELDTNCYLIQSKKELCLIDTRAESDLIIKNIKRSKAKLKYIINTHYYFDHTSKNKEIQKECGG